MADDSSQPPNPSQRSPWLLPLMLFAFGLLWLSYQPATPELPYSTLIDHIEADRVVQVQIRGEEISGRFTQPVEVSGSPTESFKSTIPAGGDPNLLPVLREHRVEIAATNPESGTWTRALLGLLPVLILISFFWVLSRSQLRGLGGGDPRNLGKLVNEVPASEERPSVTFDDVAGQANAKREVSEVVEFLRDPAPFRKLGAQMPRGLLLMGPPGTGKTLLARALAGEAGVPFYSISGSAFIEVFVGVGASRVRKLFEQARQNSPSIVFIDELDSIGRTRGTGLGGGHDEREQTLNQILAEMDGFTPDEAVIVLAATNRPDVLDPALLRPGRFDRHVTVDLPDRKDRLAVLRLYVDKIILGEDVKLADLAGGTPGFSGAELKNLVNEAAIRAAKRRAKAVENIDFQEAMDHLMLGAERSLIIQPDERRRLAVHEAGHALVASYLPNADPIFKMTILPRGRALGVTQQLPSEEHYTLSEPYLQDRLAILFGGRAAEEQVFANTSSGAEDDIKQATALARAMVTRWGMSELVGPVDLRQRDEHPFLGLEMTQAREHSERSAGLVDDAVKQLLETAESQAVELVRQHQPALDRLAAALLEHESLDASAIQALLEKQEDTLLPFPSNRDSSSQT